MSTVQNVLDRKGSSVLAIHPGISVYAAACLMNDKRIGGLVVVENSQVVGIFTERDILKRVVGTGLDPAYATVREVMTSPVYICDPDTPLDELAEAITSRRIRHIPVVKDGLLRGIITSGDILAQQFMESREQLVYLNEYIHGV